MRSPAAAIMINTITIFITTVVVMIISLSANTCTAAWPQSAPTSWTLKNLGTGAVPYFEAGNGDKDGSIVAARLAGATNGVSDTRQLYYNVTRRGDALYAADVAALVVNSYDNASVLANGSNNPLLVMQGGAVVVSSVHRLALYIAEAMHAPLLPAQVLEFADNWTQACWASANGSVVLVGYDFGYDGLWLWVKPGSPGSVPAPYLSVLQAASKLVIVYGTDGDSYVGGYKCPAKLGGATLYIHSSLATAGGTNAKALYQAALPNITALPANVTSSLRQWEWGLPDFTIKAYKDAWAGLGKAAADLKVIAGGVVPGFQATPAVWKTYLTQNSIAPRGVGVYSYWIAAPALDRRDATLPVPAYAFYKTTWHPLYDTALSYLNQIKAANTSLAIIQASSRGFINLIGSNDDVTGIKLLFSTFGISPFVTVGLDCPPASCTTTASVTTPCAHVYAAQRLQSLPPVQTNIALTVSQVCTSLGTVFPCL